MLKPTASHDRRPPDLRRRVAEIACGGITNTVNYRSFDLSVFFALQYGNKVYNHNRFFGEGGGAREGARVIFKSNLERWQKPGDITDVPRPDGVTM